MGFERAAGLYILAKKYPFYKGFRRKANEKRRKIIEV